MDVISHEKMSGESIVMRNDRLAVNQQFDTSIDMLEVFINV